MNRVIIYISLLSLFTTAPISAQELFEFQTFSPGEFDSLNWKQRGFYSFNEKPILKYDIYTVQWSIDTNSIYIFRENKNITFKLNDKLHVLKFKYRFDDMKHLTRYINDYKIEFFTKNFAKGSEWGGWDRICITYNKEKICKKLFSNWK